VSTPGVLGARQWSKDVKAVDAILLAGMYLNKRESNLMITMPRELADLLLEVV